MDPDSHRPDTRENAKHPSGSTAFLGVRHPVAKAALAAIALAAIVLGAYAVYDRYVLAPRRHEAIQSGEAAERLFTRWQRKGTRGWDRLFTEAARGYPGYNVDTGRPARLKLVELGDRIVPFANEKLDDPDHAVRISAIYVLGAVGQPQDRIAQLLVREVRRARSRSEVVEAIKCANVMDNTNAVLGPVAFAAIESPYRKAREIAAEYLVRLADKPDIDPFLRERLDELRDTGDIRARVELAMRTRDTAPVETYTLLLEVLASDDDEVRTIAANHIARLRDGDPIRDDTPPEAIPAILERHREYLNVALAVARIDEDWRAAFKALAEGIHSGDEQMVLGVINLVNALRGLPTVFASERIESRGPKMDEQRDYVRIGLAAAAAETDPATAYTALLEGLDSAGPKMPLDVAVIVARMRGLPPHFDAENEHTAVAEQRAWVQEQLDDLSRDASTDESAESTTTAPPDESEASPSVEDEVSDDGTTMPEQD